MALIDAIVSAIAAVDKATLSLQGTVTHEAWTGANVRGDPTYAAAVNRQAIVDYTNKEIRTEGGRVVTVFATLMFLEPVAAQGASGRREPIDPRDKLTLPDGRTGAIIDVPGAVMHPSTGKPLFNQVGLGIK